MQHETSLIAIIVIGLGLAFVFGTIAHRLKISPLVGYLLAGVGVGPFTPGFVADQALASQLAEIGVILLMFGVGLHFSLKDLLAVRRIVFPGAAVQVIVSTVLGIGAARWFGWSTGAGVVFGLALSVASTVVVLRALTEHRLLETERGHIAMGWLVFQDMLMVLVLVLLPPLSGLLGGNATSAAPFDLAGLTLSVGITIGKVALFIAIMLVIGRRLIPAILHYIAHTGSRELFRLAVLAIALGVAFFAAALFGVSFALGAFFAGMVLSESALSQQAAEETLPLRDAFAVLFFVSVGMLFDPMVLIREPGALLVSLLVVMIGGAGTAVAMVRGFGYPLATALLVGICLAQIGEFSFILADLGIGLGILPARARDLILGTAILSILLNPLLFIALDRVKNWVERHPGKPTHPTPPEPLPLAPTQLTGHAVLIGYGRVGRLVGDDLAQAGWPLYVIEDSADTVAALHAQNIAAIAGNAAAEEVLATANLAQARILLVAIPNAFEACEIVKYAHAANPQLEIVARAHFDAEVEQLRGFGAGTVIMGEREIARTMIEHVRALAS